LLKSRSPFGNSNSFIASKPQKEITKIEFSQKEKKLTLEKEGSNWLINDRIETRKAEFFLFSGFYRRLK